MDRVEAGGRGGRAGRLEPHRRTLGFFGPALGAHDGWVTTQGEVLAGLFLESGTDARVSSTSISPVRRASDHVRDLFRWRQDLDVAIVSVFSGRGFALADESLTVARALRVPSVAWLHGGNLPAFGAAHPRWARRVLCGADAVVAPSAYLARWAEATGVHARIVPNVIDLAATPFRARRELRPRLLWMRTFQELYDPATAVRALARLRAGSVDAHLTMAGQDKGLLEEVRTLARDLGLSDAVTFPGFASGDAKARLFDDHDLFINTNTVDNAPVTVLEAAASGLVVVSTDVGGVPDLLADGVAARLVAPGRPEEVADAVATLLSRPTEAADLSRAARAVAERSSWPAVHDDWLALVDRLSPDRGG